MWQGVPEGTESLAIGMYHYLRATGETVNLPSHYWLLWNVPVTISEIPIGNPGSIGIEGADKDGRDTGYTPPCSPGAALHDYTTTFFALAGSPHSLPTHHDPMTDWAAMIAAIDNRIIASTELTFVN
ncbi:hypothetical protein BWR18_15335 [Tateyamaria omphalii]|uniref:Uncharacterized protein n=2 Tax=Tateyamaria omphalii TaxID=299262 RepID=A0A1P8MXZ4_9RHOB|nr:hypothetical protein BWR18_15335 [Tateyamaria omphalii]